MYPAPVSKFMAANCSISPFLDKDKHKKMVLVCLSSGNRIKTALNKERNKCSNSPLSICSLPSTPLTLCHIQPLNELEV